MTTTAGAMASGPSAISPASTSSSRKLVLLGESAVGKSSLVLQFVKGQFDDYRESTIGAAFLTQTVKVEQGFVKFEIWDTAGQERYKSLAPMYYRNAHSAIVVYDITSSTSLLKARSWIAELQRQADPGIVVCLAGNKSDLENRREVQREEAEAFAKDEGLLFFECSAKSNEGVVEMFNAIANKLPLDTPTMKTRAGTTSAARGGVDLSRNAAGTTDGACAC